MSGQPGQVSAESRPETHPMYSTSWVANGLSWDSSYSDRVRLAVSSYIRDYKNYVEIIEMDDSGHLSCTAAWEHCYPPTKVMFPPKQMANDYVITTADYLRLWEVTPAPEGDDIDTAVSRQGTAARAQSKVNVKRVFDYGRPNEFCSPVTSCDWNSEEVNVVGCCSVDTTVTIWDIEQGQQITKLVAHDKDVYDIAFASAKTFASCGADGSVRLFDLRNMDHCTILYETSRLSPLLRIAWNQQDPNYISTFGLESAEAVVIDIRYPSVPASVLSNRHQHPINSMSWSPQSAQNICTGGEDGIVCIWGADVGEFLFESDCYTPINNVVWCRIDEKDWIAITTSEGVKLLRV